jgi:hypothetical protein
VSVQENSATETDIVLERLAVRKTAVAEETPESSPGGGVHVAAGGFYLTRVGKNALPDEKAYGALAAFEIGLSEHWFIEFEGQQVKLSEPSYWTGGTYELTKSHLLGGFGVQAGGSGVAVGLTADGGALFYSSSFSESRTYTFSLKAFLRIRLLGPIMLGGNVRGYWDDSGEDFEVLGGLFLRF